MAVVSVNEDYSGRRAQVTEAGASYTRVFKVVVGAATDGPYVAIYAASIPDYGDAHPHDTSAKVTTITAEPVDNDDWQVHRVTVTYNDKPSGWAASPLDEDPKIQWSGVERTAVQARDRNDNAILNSAGDLFDPPLEGTLHEPEVTIVKNQAHWNPFLAAQYRGAINSDTVKIAGFAAAPGQALMTVMDGTTANRNGVDYIEATYRIRFWPTYRTFLLDHGLHYLVTIGATTYKRRIMVNGEEVQEPQRLDGSGGVLALDGDSVFLEFDTKREKVFGDLNLPTDFE